MNVLVRPVYCHSDRRPKAEVEESGCEYSYRLGSVPDASATLCSARHDNAQPFFSSLEHQM
jgi:hypothetical protein